MLFNRDKNSKKCEKCRSKVSQDYPFCPYCGSNLIDPIKEQKDYGLLGRHDAVDNNPHDPFSDMGMGLSDKMIASLFNMVMKSLDKQLQKQFKEFDKAFENAEVKQTPNGIRIKIETPLEPKSTPQVSHSVKKQVNEDQMKKISSLPRTKAKTSVKRIGDKVIYELSTPGVSSSEDIFVSKLESGYEIKAIGKKNVYVNSIPISLPLKKFSILKDKLQVEFNTGEQHPQQ